MTVAMGCSDFHVVICYFLMFGVRCSHAENPLFVKNLVQFNIRPFLFENILSDIFDFYHFQIF